MLNFFKTYFQKITIRRDKRNLFLDISTIIRYDHNTGIQRVVKSILKYCLNTPLKEFDIKPIYFDDTGKVFYARQFTCKMLGIKPDTSINDSEATFQKNDIVLYLDFYLNDYFIKRQIEIFKTIGVKVYFIVYDLLPLQSPQWFPDNLANLFEKWFNLISNYAAGLICISKTVANDVQDFLKNQLPELQSVPKIGYFHLGADIENSMPSKGITDNFSAIIQAYSARPTFLLVTCIAPRKGHEQTLAAFEQLWSAGIDINLVFIGRVIFEVNTLVEKLLNHPEKNKRLFWLDNASDEMLVQSYNHATAVIIASEGEGFGIPLIEAAKHQVPIIVRDLPVFREIVSGDHVFYFSGLTPEALANAIKNWLILHQSGKVPESKYIPWQTWSQSSEQLLNIIINDYWYSDNTK